MSEKSAAVYLFKGNYFIHSMARTDAGFWIASMPASLLSAESSIEEIGSAALEALEASVNGVRAPRRDEFAKLHAPLLEVAAIRSWLTLQRAAALVNIRLERSSISVEPTRNGGTGGDGRGYHPLEDQCVRFPADINSAALGEAVISAFDRCL